MRSIAVFGGGTTGWQMLAAEDDGFEESVMRLCELNVAGDPRIGKVPVKKGGRRLRSGGSQARRSPLRQRRRARAPGPSGARREEGRAREGGAPRREDRASSPGEDLTRRPGRATVTTTVARSTAREAVAFISGSRRAPRRRLAARLSRDNVSRGARAHAPRVVASGERAASERRASGERAARQVLRRRDDHDFSFRERHFESEARPKSAGAARLRAACVTKRRRHGPQRQICRTNRACAVGRRLHRACIELALSLQVRNETHAARIRCARSRWGVAPLDLSAREGVRCPKK